VKLLTRAVPLFLIALVACSKSTSSTIASSSPEASVPAATSAAPAVASASCASLSHLTPLTDKGVKTATGSTFALEADNDNGQFYFNPSCVKSTGGTLTITVKNVGNVEHNFSIASLKINKDIPKGQSVTVSVKLPTSGTLAFFCEYHHTSGMQGAFIVG